MITPNPDPTSRFPTSYCLTCGGGFTVTNCPLNDYTKCNFGGELSSIELAAWQRIEPLPSDRVIVTSNPVNDGWAKREFVNEWKGKE